MTSRSIDTDARVQQLLRSLGWNSRAKPESWLRDHVRKTIGHWLHEAGIVVARLDTVVRVVADRLKVKLVEIDTDEILRSVVHSYCERSEYAFATLPREFEGNV